MVAESDTIGGAALLARAISRSRGSSGRCPGRRLSTFWANAGAAARPARPSARRSRIPVLQAEDRVSALSPAKGCIAPAREPENTRGQEIAPLPPIHYSLLPQRPSALLDPVHGERGA